MSHPPTISTALLAIAFCIAADLSTAIADDEIGNEFFEKRIRPVLVEHCYECHSASAKEPAGGLLLDARLSTTQGGDSGPAIQLDSPAQSLLLQAMRHQTLKMPPTNRLPDNVIEDFERWIKAGAPDPRTDVLLKSQPVHIDWESSRQFWSFRPRQNIQVPIAYRLGEYGPLDRFIREKQLAVGVTPSPEANRSTWLRRVTVDLTGLVPSAEEVDRFVQSRDEDCFEQVVDRLLSSRAYGERWGRHWLDLARYADSNGADENHRYPNAWRYRDYVVESFNRDTSFDQFIVEQLAGDLLPTESESERRRFLTATGFLVIGPKMLAEQDKPKLVADLVDEQLDTVGKVFLGLTLGCARCHDHKFDPITASDYYSLAGILHSTRSMEHLNHVAQWNERELPDSEIVKSMEQHNTQLQEAKNALKAERIRLHRRALDPQLHSLLAAMHLDIGRLHNHSMSSEMVDQELVKNIERLRNPNPDSSTSDVLGVWHQLRVVEHSKFSESSQHVWQEVTRESPNRSPWLIRLSRQAPPKSHFELIQCYASTLEPIIQELIVAARNEKGELESPEMNKLFDQLFGSNPLFSFPAKVEDTLGEPDKTTYMSMVANVEKLTKDKPTLPRAMAVAEGPVKLVAIHVRGNHLQTTGAPLSRDVPKVLQTDSAATLTIPENESGRLQFAQWIASPNNPLTARVIVNRVWQGHFGQGIVATPSNFGLRGQPPSHPELLDWLANEFIEHGWSIKWLHRQIVLSATYRMQSNVSEFHQSDPDNRWLWRQNKRRLEAEALRDVLLSLGDALLDRTGGGAQSISTPTVPNFEGAGSIGSMRRSLYLEVNRAAMNDYLTTFDYVEPGVSVDKRSATIVPHQALYLMNHSLPQEIGRRMAQQACSTFSTDRDRLRYLIKTLFNREPSPAETTAIGRLLFASSDADHLSPQWNLGNASVDSWTKVCRALLLTNEFLYVE